MTIYLARPEGQDDIPVIFNTGQHGNRTVLTFQAERYFGVLYNFDPKEFAATLRSLADRYDPPAQHRQNPEANTWEWLTPQAVIDYFQQSPVLHPHAADVRAVLGPLVEQSQAEAGQDRISLDVERLKPLAAELFDDDGQPVYGAQTKAAEILDLPGTGGSYRRRILQALDELRRAA